MKFHNKKRSRKNWHRIVVPFSTASEIEKWCRDDSGSSLWYYKKSKKLSPEPFHAQKVTFWFESAAIATFVKLRWG